jgi:hypothetical protein
MKEVQITDLPKRQAGVLDGDFEKLGYELLAFGNEGPLIVRKRDGPKLYYWLLFHTDRSTLPYRVSRRFSDPGTEHRQPRVAAVVAVGTARGDDRRAARG